jgi:hypothetical protein
MKWQHFTNNPTATPQISSKNKHVCPYTKRKLPTMPFGIKLNLTSKKGFSSSEDGKQHFSHHEIIPG